jgi:phosphoserine phosphatase RsbU/P
MFPDVHASPQTSLTLTVNRFSKTVSRDDPFSCTKEVGASRFTLQCVHAWNAASTVSQLRLPSAINVPKTIPSYLRVLRDPESLASSEPAEERNPAEHFWDMYSRTTGWRIDQRAARVGKVHMLAAVDTLSSEDPHAPNLVSKAAATSLAESAIELTAQLATAQETIRCQEAELAVRAAILTGQSQQVQLADQLQTTLADAALACGCDTAALYILDEQTQFLRTSAVFGLPPARLQKAPRNLRGSRADLEAMVQGVVMIDDLHDCTIDTWNCPEKKAAAGICVVITSDGVPVGTLWLFKNTTAEFGLRESAVARMAAAQLALLLTNSATETATPRTSENPIHEVAQWQCEALPVGANLAPGWRVDGMIESPQAWATGFHFWDVLPDGTLMLVIAEAVERSAKGAMAAAIARSAIAAHAGYRHTPAQLLQRVSDTLWQTSSGEQLVSMLYARVDAETGEGEVASAGSITAMIASQCGYRPLVSGNSDPLNRHIDTQVTTESFRMLSGETLLAYSAGVSNSGMTQMQLGNSLRTAMRKKDLNPLAAIRREMASLSLDSERGAISLLRV